MVITIPKLTTDSLGLSMVTVSGWWFGDHHRINHRIDHKINHAGWWFATCFLSHILGTITPFDFHIFQRARYTTNQLWHFAQISNLLGRLVLERYAPPFSITSMGFTVSLRDWKHKTCTEARGCLLTATSLGRGIISRQIPMFCWLHATIVVSTTWEAVRTQGHSQDSTWNYSTCFSYTKKDHST